MTRVMLLKALKDFVEEATSSLKMPETVQKGDTEQVFRAPDIYVQKLPNSDAAKKYIPYGLIQLIMGEDKQPEGDRIVHKAHIRIVFTAYDKDEQEGSIMLLNFIEKVRMALLSQVVVGESFKLDTEEGLETAIYTDDTAPYYIGEMTGTFILPPIRRKVDYTNGF